MNNRSIGIVIMILVFGTLFGTLIGELLGWILPNSVVCWFVCLGVLFFNHITIVFVCFKNIIANSII